MNLHVDLNADLGEGAGDDKELLKLVSSASIACGFHAGDAETMHETISAARDQGVTVGAHPSLFDRENKFSMRSPTNSVFFRQLPITSASGRIM